MSKATLLAALATSVDAWSEQGNCAQEGADPFFARLGEIDDTREALAKAECAICPVLAECLRWALSVGDPAGVWAGGTNTVERLAFRAS